jgi:predicted oxidoreductase
MESSPPTLSPIVAGLWRLHEWRLDVPARVRWVQSALDLGISTFDHADIYGEYGNEALFGEALAAVPGLRERLTLVTKCGIRLVSPARPAHGVNHYDSSRAHIAASVDASLAALRTDRIDLLLIHRPDPLADPDEIADTFAALQRAGKVRAFGVSNHTPAQFERLHRRFPLATNQFELSPLQMRALADGTLEQAAELGVPPMAWSPLGRGRLFADDEQARRVRAVLEELGRPHGVGAATMAYAWVRRHPARPRPITGTGRLDGLREAVASLPITLSREDWTRVWQASMGHPVP